MSLPPDRLTLAALAAALEAGQLDPTLLDSDARSGSRRLAARWSRRQARMAQERRRLEGLFAEERSIWAQGLRPVAGVDEAGRGPLAGPVVAAAVIFPIEQHIPRLRDSKRVPPRERETVY